MVRRSDSGSDGFKRLRDDAERRAQERLEDARNLDGADRDQLLQELQVHQIELELQNEELRRAQGQLEITRQQYMDLYNKAPIGYASLDESGLILRANDTLARLLEVDVTAMRGCSLAEFIETQDQPIFRGRFKAFARKPDRKHIDVRFRGGRGKRPGSAFTGRIQGRRIALDRERYGHSARWEEALLVVISDVTELKKSEQKIRFQAFHDGLTGLPNRASLYDRLDTALASARRHKRFGALLFMDLDRFKNINDSLGHHAGDELLVGFVERFRRQMRREDLLARMGGDEFIVLLSEQDADGGRMAVSTQRFAEHLTQSLAEPFLVLGNRIRMTVSVGVSVFPAQPDDGVHDIIRQADTAMYQAKSAGRNRVRFFRSAMQERARRRLTQEAELQEALARKQFEMHYQPQVTANGSIRAIEALLRWRHPKRGLVLPGEFIGMTEETGLIVPLGEWVLEHVCAQVSEWQAAGLCTSDLEVAVNLSARQFQEDGFGAWMTDTLSRYGTEASCLIFEITESLLLPDDQACCSELERLAQLGLNFSVDDFGTGYSSLSVLQKAPVAQLKIDRRFIRDLETGVANQAPEIERTALVRAIVSMAKELGMEVVAEGVETERQRQALLSLECDLMQGFLFSPPVPEQEITLLLEQARSRGSILSRASVPGRAILSPSSGPGIDDP